MDTIPKNLQQTEVGYDDTKPTFITTTQINQILEEQCTLHSGFRCDLIDLNKNVKDHRVCSQCLQENQIDNKEIISIKNLLSPTPHTFLSTSSLLNDSSLISAVRNIFESVEKLEDVVDKFFENLKDIILKSIEIAKVNVKTDFNSLTNSYKVTLGSFENALLIDQFQKIVASQSREALTDFINDSREKSDQNKKIIEDNLKEFEKIKSLFSLNQPLQEMKNIQQSLKNLRFFSQPTQTDQNQASSPSQIPHPDQSSFSIIIEMKTFPNGAIYEGQLKKGIPHGYGKFLYPDGDRFEGELKEDMMDGLGKFFWANGDRYEGDFKEDKENGLGKQFWANGNRFEGEWKDGKKNGYGKFYQANGNHFEGEYKDDKKNGFGKQSWISGDRFEGQFKDNQFNGLGKYFWANGNLFVGQFKEGNFHGNGIKYDSAGVIIQKGVWKNDIFSD